MKKLLEPCRQNVSEWNSSDYSLNLSNRGLERRRSNDNSNNNNTENNRVLAILLMTPWLMSASSTKGSTCPVYRLTANNNSNMHHYNNILQLRVKLMAPPMMMFFEPIKSDNSRNNNFGHNNMRKEFNQLRTTEACLDHYRTRAPTYILQFRNVMSAHLLNLSTKRLKFLLHTVMCRALSSRLVTESSSSLLARRRRGQRLDQVNMTDKNQIRKCSRCHFKSLHNLKCRPTTAHIQMPVLSQ
jgi:hypothetical protein